MITWRAVYRDNKCLNQYNEDGTTNRYEDIDRWRLIRFDLLKDKEPFYSLYMRRGQRLIYRKRTFVSTPLRKDAKPPTKFGWSYDVYLVGWQQTFDTTNGKKNVTVINYIHPDGSITLDGSRDNLNIREVELM